MNDKLYIPNKINVGYQERSDTYTQKLAYIIYWDDKGVLRKETSWNSWRDKKIDNSEIENVPTEGFVLNRKAGGYSSGWNHRATYCRVYDPRGFEFEISIPNLLFILEECTSTKGKGLEGEFVYSWQGTELVLLPASSQDYKNSTDYTALQGVKVTRKDMVPGCSYTSKENEELIYLGRFDWSEMGSYYLETIKEQEEREKKEHESRYGRNRYYSSSRYNRASENRVIVEKRHIFIKEDGSYENSYRPCKYHTEKGFTKLATRNTEVAVDNYSDLLEEYHNSQYGSKPKSIVTAPKVIDFKDIDKDRSWRSELNGRFSKEVDGVITTYTIGEKRNYRDESFLGWELNGSYNYKMKDGMLVKDYTRNNDRDKAYTEDELNEMGFLEASIELESGNKVEIETYN